MENKDELIESVETVETVEPKEFGVEIEERRSSLYSEFLKSRKVGNILTFVILIISIAGMMLISSGGIFTVIGWALLLLGVAGMIVFYFTSKKKFEKHTLEYLNFVNASLNKETFSDSVYKDIDETNDKIEVKDFEGNGVYSNIVRVASRNIVNAKYKNTAFKFAEAALYTKTDNKKQPVKVCFVGKYFEAENSLKMSGNIVINIGREKIIDEPNAVAERSTLYSSDNIVVYGDEGVDFRAVLGEEFIGKIKKISVEEHMMNCAISVSEGHTYVFMSYDDDVIAMPFDKSFNVEAFKTFVKDLKNVFGVLSYLGK
ncbi:MAG: hypothetical protein MJZ37_04890 [Bacilli bacterium]|nr:hypothetical protein [Bacilli bacterium]